MNTNQSESPTIDAGLRHAFLNKEVSVNREFYPSLLTNNFKKGKKVLTTLEKQLKECDSFEFSVAFITMSGIEPLLMTFKELERKNIPGRILTTDYLTFSEPDALAKLASLKNLEVRMYVAEEDGFHTKGYIFHKDHEVRIIVGSSNMTMNALTRSQEWNAGLLSLKEGAFAQEISSQFERLWHSNHSKNIEDVIDTYRQKYKLVQDQKRVAASRYPISPSEYVLLPNQMQVEFTKELIRLRDAGEDRALLISATGTGKTYASAFGLRELKPKKALFLVHREQIAKQAKESYQRVLGPAHTYGLISGNVHEYGKDYTFATVQTASKDSFLDSTKPDEFDVVVIDEVHRAGANSYQKIMNKLKPKFWLGMSASPDRNDGFDIYSLFDHNIASEIRLQQALEEDYLAPFHYFGLSDLSIESNEKENKTGNLQAKFDQIEFEQRINHIMEQAKYYGHSGTNGVKGLIFVSSKDEAKRLSEGFNRKGWKTLPLSGDDSQQKREEAIDRLVSDDRSDRLDYLITVDIFNEGVDIPEINQVIMLRPTQSAIVFIQQLGRGLRKAKGKEFVVVLDFIGNYESNYLIPVALSGDSSYNKDNMRRFIQEGANSLPGMSSVHFDEVARSRIYAAVDQAKTNTISLLKEAYAQLKYKLGRIPDLVDYDRFESIDPNLFFNNKSLGSYPAFLMKYEKEFTSRLSELELEYLKFLSVKFGAGKWIDELIIIQALINDGGLVIDQWKDLLIKNDILVTEYTIQVLKSSLSGNYAAGTGAEKMKRIQFVEEETGRISFQFQKMLENRAFKQSLTNLFKFSLNRNKRNYSERYKETKFKLYSKYTYEEVCRLLEWDRPVVAQNVGGYWIDHKTKTYPVFINYDKKEAEEHLQYHDRFLNRYTIRAMSKNGRTHESKDMQTALNAKDQEYSMHLFIRKNKDDAISKEFYYLGEIFASGWYEDQKNVNGKNITEIEYDLEVPVPEELYDYITN